jgi:hypothetical protein
VYGGKLGRMNMSSRPVEIPARRGPPMARYDTKKPTTSMPAEATHTFTAAKVPAITKIQLPSSATAYSRSRCLAVPAMLDIAPRDMAAKQA